MKMLRYRIPFIIIVIFIIGFSVYSNSFENDSFITNSDSILKIPLIQNHRNIPLLFTSAMLRYTQSQYRPLSLVMFSLFKILIKNEFISTWRFLLIFFHIINAVLLFFIIFILCRNYLFSFLGSIIFLVHPAAMAVVNIIDNFQYLLGMFFLMNVFISILMFIHTGKTRYYVIFILFYICGLLSSNIVYFIIPVIFLLFLLYYFKKLKHSSVSTFIILVTLIFVSLFYHYITFNIRLTPHTMFQSDSKTFSMYLFSFFNTFKMNILCVMKCIAGYKKDLFNPDNHFYIYTALITYSFIIACFLSFIYNKSKKYVKYILLFIILFSIVYYAQKTFIFNTKYSDNTTYWKTVKENGSGDSENAEFQLAKTYYERKMYYKAKKHFYILTIKGKTETRAKALFYLADIFRKEKDPGKAFQYLLKMYRLKHIEWQHIDGELSSSYEEKISKLFSKEILYSKQFYLGFGKALYDIGILDWSENYFSQLHLYDPYNIEYIDYLGQIFIYKKYYKASKIYYKRILELNPDYTKAIRRINYIDDILSDKIKNRTYIETQKDLSMHEPSME